MPDPTQSAGEASRRGAAPRLFFGWSWSAGPLALVLGLACLVFYGRMSGLYLLVLRQRAELAAGQRQTQAALAQGAGLRAAAALMAAPDTQVLDARAAGAARARVYLNPGRGAVLVAAALPPAGAGRAYQLWLLPRSGPPRPAGTFQADAGGAAVAVVPHALASAVGLAVSVEPAGGRAQPSGAFLLTARRPQP